MDISEKLNTQQLALEYDNKTYNHVCSDNTNGDTAKLYILIPPSLIFYQWNDFGKSSV